MSEHQLNSIGDRVRGALLDASAELPAQFRPKEDQVQVSYESSPGLPPLPDSVKPPEQFFLLVATSLGSKLGERGIQLILDAKANVIRFMLFGGEDY